MSHSLQSIPSDDDLSSDDDCDCEPWNDVYCEEHQPESTPKPKERPAYLPPLPKENQCPHGPKTAAALEWALERLDVQMRQNMRRYTCEWRQHKGGILSATGEWVEEKWQEMTGRAAAYIRAQIEERYVVKGYNGIMPLKFGRDMFNEGLDAMLYSREVDPFVDYLDELPAVKGRRYLSGSLAHCFDVKAGYEPLAEWASRSIFLGAVWRAYKPGTILDEMPIIVGPGGIGKTSYLRLAPPPGIPGLYGSGLDLAETPKGKVEALQGKAIVECSDMMGSTVGDANKIKDFISRTDDGSVRLAYRRDPEPSPRRCVLVGTA